MSETGPITDEILCGKNHPGNPRVYFGPIKTDPANLFIHTTEDLKNLDHFMEFLIGNGQMVCRLDALCSQHITGRKTRGIMGLNHSDAWGAEAFPFYRCRPVGKLCNQLLITSDCYPLETTYISDYFQTVHLETGILETKYDWQHNTCRGHTKITAFMSQVDPEIMILRFCDHVEEGVAKRNVSVETLVDYYHRFITDLAESKKPTEPINNANYASDNQNTQWIDFSFCSQDTNTQFVWYAKAITDSSQKIHLKMHPCERGGMKFEWDCNGGQQIQVDIVFAIISDRSTPSPYQKAKKLVSHIDKEGITQYQNRHMQKWLSIWKQSYLHMKNKFWQKQFEIARYTLLINTGGNWLGNIAADEFAWDAHMLDSVMALNALLEWGHVDLVKKGFDSLDRLYPGAVDNSHLISKYIGKEVISESALLPTFLTYNGRVALYAINHFMLHSEQNSAHALGLIKLADYLDADNMWEGIVYKWLRAYANYALLISEWSDKWNGYVFPIWKAGTLQEGEWWHDQLKDLPLTEINTIKDLFPDTLRQKKLCTPIDIVLSHKWILKNAYTLAVRLNRDNELRTKWLEVADKIYVPHSEKIILRHEHDNGKSKGHIPAELWGLFYPCEGNYRLFPQKMGRIFSTFFLF